MCQEFHKRPVLAHFCCLFGRQRVFAREIKLPEVSWNSAELERVAGRRRAWLEEEAREALDQDRLSRP